MTEPAEDRKPLAQRLVDAGLSRSYASQLANGRRTPSLALAHRLQREAGIPIETWLDSEAA